MCVGFQIDTLIKARGIYKKIIDYHMFFTVPNIDTLLSQCQLEMFRHYEKTPDKPIFQPKDKMKFCDAHAPGLFQLLLKTITRHDPRLTSKRKALQEQRVVSLILIHIMSYFRSVVCHDIITLVCLIVIYQENKIYHL